MDQKRDIPLELSPAQQTIFDRLVRDLDAGNVFVLWGAPGKGRTSVLRNLYDRIAGAFLSMGQLTDEMSSQHPLAIEETFEKLVMRALRENVSVIVDDLDLLTDLTCNHFYPRSDYIKAPLTTLGTFAQEQGKKLIFGTRSTAPEPIAQRCFYYGIPDFTPADYEHLCRAYLPDSAASGLDYAKIHRFAPKLNAHQLKTSCEWLSREDDLDTERFVAYLRSQRLTSNVNIGEVQAVDLHDLRGIDDVIHALEVNVILPLENDELAAELSITPKRGVLLAGLPGTGKTTIGRALAHRLQSKFFLIDGTTISGTGDFYRRIHDVFQAAKDNAPSIVFIDDSDVIFESGEEMGLYRYLLTTLDGLESESAARVAVMMTAMNVANLPPALVRSGRIELWLEMRLPDAAARADILRTHLTGVPASLEDTDIAQLVGSTEGFTGADVKRLVEDGKLLFAYDKARGLPLRPPTSYFLDAAATVRANKERYATAEAQARRQRPRRPPYYDISDRSPPSL